MAAAEEESGGGRRRILGAMSEKRRSHWDCVIPQTPIQ